MLSLLREKLLEVVAATAPLIIVACLLQVTLVHAPIAVFLQFIMGSMLAVVGMLLFLTGIDFGVLPMGRFIGAELPKRRSWSLIIAVVFSLGFAVTVSEPDVLVLSGLAAAAKQGAMSQETILYATGLGFAVFAALAMVRIIAGWSTRCMLTAAYSLVLALSLFTPADFVPLAFDAGSVTTGVLSAPVLIALAIGFSSVLAGRSVVSDGFGFLGFASIGPILAILITGILKS